ncbi:uncharacterized protein LOC132742246 [Ruditapes philippinarum]|uniref:uncharacterized protein LOC132742246 n=1 Tax=Ruditapes philippinarum TaxID=129788 RepID=UPI00295B2B8D|nr:uncharacterized protein LOC132742246 [Ruditapes philippinarum]
MKAHIFAIFTLIVLMGIHCDAEVLKSNGTAGKDLNAKTLVSYGREFNDSLITMIGRVIENYHVCTAWSEWSECGAKATDFFSTRTRTRRCGETGARFGHRDEIEAGVCEGGTENKTKTTCPVSYHTTTKGFCLKLYTEAKTHSDAVSVCKRDGGYLVNIDSDQKYDDIKAIIIANNITTQINIDGNRVNSQWKFSYGSTNGYFHWFPNNPSSNHLYNCLRLAGNRPDANHRFRTYNYLCDSDPIPFICEFVFN